MFYEGEVGQLAASIERCFTGPLGPGEVPQVAEERKGDVLGLVCPHAGYVYSGSACAHSMKALYEDGIPQTVIVMGPNHQGMGAPVAVSPESGWQTPMGPVIIDDTMAKEIVETSKYVSYDSVAHSREHSLEVIMPFLQYAQKEDLKTLPIAITHLNFDEAIKLVEDLGSALAKVAGTHDTMIIASTDFTHYEPRDVAEKYDQMAYEAIEAMDGKKLVETVYTNNITMCGVVGTAVMLEACKKQGATKAEKLAYYTSGEVSGDMSSVVGYMAVAVKK